MKRMLTITLVALCTQFSTKAQVTLHDAFANAPDDIFPLLTQCNRLDCLDFAKGKVNMEISNKASERTRIDSLTQDYMRILMSPVSYIELRMLPATEHDPQRICMIHTCKGPAEDSHVYLYTTQWTMLGTVERPCATDFFDNQLDRESRGILTDLSLMQATFTTEGNSLIWTMPLTELNSKQRKAAQEHVHSVVRPIAVQPEAKP